MPKAKRSFEEERVLLLENDEGLEVSHRFFNSAFETAIAKGVTNHVGKWPSHLFAAFLAASLVFAAFILFALVTALFCIPTANYRCRRAQNDFTVFPNVYFVKHSNRTWSREELCYVESSARDNSEINVYLINLLIDSTDDNGFSIVKNVNHDENVNKKRDMIEMLVFWEQANNSIDETINLSSNITEEARIRKKLGALYDNVKNVDVTIDDFFKGSMLTHVCHDLDPQTLEIAAKANILWNTPGIALDPSDFRRIRNSKRYLCNRGCKVPKNAAINSRGSFQASGEPCQAFVGYLMHEIAINGISDNRDIVKRATGSFCQSFRECPGLEIQNDENSSNLPQSPNCPAIYPLGIPATRTEKFTTGSTGNWG